MWNESARSAEDESSDDSEDSDPLVKVVNTSKACRLHRSLKWASLDKLLPEAGVELTLGELQEMACRQQHQIDSQHQLLVAKEQRLRFLKQQEARHHQVAAENERLRRLRDRVEAQELKLRKLRALRGQVDQNKLNNASLTSDLDSIRALFNEKEKELSLAVAKVEELTRQLEELKKGRGSSAAARDQSTPSPAALELEKLRRELMYRNKLNEQQNARLCQQREALSQRQEEMSNIDKRISELQDRLHRKRLLNQQMANQISAASNKAAGQQQQQLRGASSATTIQQQQQQGQNGKGKLLRPVTSGNIAAIEPYHHVPVGAGNQHNDSEKQAQLRNTQSSGVAHLSKEGLYHSKHILQQQPPDGQEEFQSKIPPSNSIQQQQHSPSHGVNAPQQNNKPKEKDDQLLSEFGGSKSDPKYQTLPYNTKFTVNFVSTTSSKLAPVSDKGGGGGRESSPPDDPKRNSDEIKNNNNINNTTNQQQQQLMTVHSIPIPALSGVNKGLATPLSNHSDQSATYQQQQQQPQQKTGSALGHLSPRPFGTSYPNPGLTRGQPVGGTSSTTSSSSSLGTSSTTTHQKPVSSVAPTSVQHQKSSPIYQTSSTKIHPVQPQTLSSTPQGMLRGELSPPQSTSTPVGTPEGLQEGRGKPALPPKPALPVKPTPPPRQTQHCLPNGAEGDTSGRVDTSADAVDSALSVLRGAATVMRSGVASHQDHILGKLPPHQVPSSEQDESTPQYRVPPCPPPPPPTSEPPDDVGSPGQRRFAGVGGNSSPSTTSDALPIIKARPLTIKKQPPSEYPKLKVANFAGSSQNGSAPVQSNNSSSNGGGVHVSINRRIEMPPAFLFPETEAPPADLVSSSTSDSSTFSTGTSMTSSGSMDEVDRAVMEGEQENNNIGKVDDNRLQQDEALVDALNNVNLEQHDSSGEQVSSQHIVMRRTKKGNLKGVGGKAGAAVSRRVSFDPLALLLDASLEGELELVRKTASQVSNPSAANDEGITALHNAICAGHLDIVKFLVEFGCDVNAQDSDGWTPLHCAASCNNLAMVRFLVEHGACIFATTLSDHETAAEKCEEDEEGFDGCSEYLYSVQEKLGILNNGVVYAVYSYEAHNPDELSFKEGDKLVVLRKGDEWEREWWWSRLNDQEGYVPRNLLGLYPRVQANKKPE